MKATTSSVIATINLVVNDESGPIAGTISFSESNIDLSYGESSFVTLNLSGSSGISNLPFSLASNNPGSLSVSPSTCYLSTESPICGVTFTSISNSSSTESITASNESYVSSSISVFVNNSSNGNGSTSGGNTESSTSGTSGTTGTNKTFQSLTINPVSESITVGESVQFTAIETFSDGSTLDITNLVTWTSSSQKIATVSNGLATSVWPGGTDINASYNGYQSTSLLTVNDKSSLVAFSPNQINLVYGTTTVTNLVLSSNVNDSIFTVNLSVGGDQPSGLSITPSECVLSSESPICSVTISALYPGTLTDEIIADIDTNPMDEFTKIIQINVTPGFTLNTLYNFSNSPDGKAPSGLLNNEGVLYGTTQYGGEDNFGTIFSYDLTTNTESVLYSFNAGSDGQQPNAGMIYANGYLYGTTNSGGSDGVGTIFSYNIANYTESILYSFLPDTDAQSPNAGLIYENGVLYGTGTTGGNYGAGAIFSYDIAKQTEAVLYSFNKLQDGQIPWSSLIYEKGFLYGTTLNSSIDSSPSLGAIFSFNIADQTESVLHYFEGGELDGASPYDDKLIYENGLLYGTTFQGGLYNVGTIFSYNLNSNTESIVYNFGVNEYDSNQPLAGLIYENGVLYGTGSGGTISPYGGIFSYDLSHQTESIVYLFGLGNTADDGLSSNSSLIDINGTLYGTTFQGGDNGLGTIFSMIIGN